jgi:hypothetical protein
MTASPNAPDVRALWAAMLREAADPATPAERLTVLWETLLPVTDGRGLTPAGEYAGARRAVFAAVVANPNAPRGLVARLAPAHPEAFCRNPAATLALLEDPGFARRLWRKRSLLRCAALPVRLLDQIAATAGDPSLADEARMHVAVAGEVADADWADAVRDYWKSSRPRRGRERDRAAELAALNLAPSWAADAKRAARLRDELREAADLTTAPLRLAELVWTADSWLVRLAAGLNPSSDVEDRAAVERDLIRRHLSGKCWARMARACRPKKRGKDDPSARILAACREAACYPRRRALSVRLATEEGVPGGDGYYWGGEFEERRLSGASLLRFVQLTGPKCPADVKKKVAGSLHWQERLGAACGLDPRHPRSADALRTLADDGNRLVRAAARARLRGETFAW